MRLRPWSRRAILLAVVPVLVGGCGLGGGGSNAPTTAANPLNTSLLPHVKRAKHHGHARPHHRPHLAPTRGARAVVTAAARLSQNQPGLRATGSLTTRVPGDSAPRRTLMAVSDALGQNALRAGLTLPLGHGYPAAVVVRGGTMYLRPPKQLAGRVAGGKRWWAVAVSALPSFSSDRNVGPVLQAASAMNSPTSYLAYVGSFAGAMHELGPATVNGIHTTHYKALAGVTQAAQVVPGALGYTVAPALRAAAAADPNALVAVDAWIDASHLVRRLHLSMTAQTQKGQPISLSLQIDFHSYLGVPTPQPPPAAQIAHPKPSK